MMQIKISIGKKNNLKQPIQSGFLCLFECLFIALGNFIVLQYHIKIVYH